MMRFANTSVAKVVVRLLFTFLLPAAALAGAAPPAQLGAARLSNVTVRHQPDATVVHIKTEGAAQYRARLFTAPDRLVLDLDGTAYGWRRNSLEVESGPLKQVRGSQFRDGMARVVLEFTRRVGY